MGKSRHLFGDELVDGMDLLRLCGHRLHHKMVDARLPALLEQGAQGAVAGGGQAVVKVAGAGGRFAGDGIGIYMTMGVNDLVQGYHLGKILFYIIKFSTNPVNGKIRSPASAPGLKIQRSAAQGGSGSRLFMV